ncbi:hypothetical protein PHET_06199 [Paragonimus heterotremus]|uniref:Uncharacterized protein n=1 Tax=Paragonimus heterotremus TaxID=100268 RepID=A0A8J4WHM6_9TREM|nr:hypothetical protein PHET_06199 [Paragonimus heterotremus]
MGFVRSCGRLDRNVRRMSKCSPMDSGHEERSDKRGGSNYSYRKLLESSILVYSSCFLITCIFLETVRFKILPKYRFRCAKA